jgi:hypothetical protein
MTLPNSPSHNEETLLQAGTRCSANVAVASTTESSDGDDEEDETYDCLVAGHTSECIA